MPKLKLSKKDLLALNHVASGGAVAAGSGAAKHLSKVNGKLTKALRTLTPANDKGKKAAKPKELKLIGRKEMERELMKFIRREEVDHLTLGEFLDIVAKRAVSAAATYKHQPTDLTADEAPELHKGGVVRAKQA